MKFRQKPYFEPETCEIRPKVVIWTCPDLPRPVQEDKYLLQTSGNIFIFSDFTPFHCLLANSSFFIRSSVLLREFIIFIKSSVFTEESLKKFNGHELPAQVLTSLPEDFARP